MGVALDGLGRHGEAQLAYAAALALQPGEASVLCNLGLSQALDGDLKKAEGTLRKASAAPGADAQVRQNLAFVIALQGRFDEASLLARQDLPPEIAAQNIAYVKTMLSTTRRWDSVKDAKSGG
jgi:Flp pilus assembly protein TadD